MKRIPADKSAGMIEEERRGRAERNQKRDKAKLMKRTLTAQGGGND
jgi:hypothetical protein